MGGMATLLFGTKRPDLAADECAEFVIDPHGDDIPREAKDAYSRSFHAGIYTALAKHPVHGFAVIQKVMGGRHCFEWREQANPDYVVPQPPPKNDPNAKPLWPMIIAEIQGEDYESRVVFRLDFGDAKRRMSIVSLVADDMQKRHEFGVAKYGVPLVAKNDRDHISDAYQEILDGIVYFRAEIERCGGFDRKIMTTRLNAIERMYKTLIEMAVDLRDLILERDGR